LFSLIHDCNKLISVCFSGTESMHYHACDIVNALYYKYIFHMYCANIVFYDFFWCNVTNVHLILNVSIKLIKII